MKTNNIIDTNDFCKLTETKQKFLIGKRVQTLLYGVGEVAYTDDKRIMVKVSVKCCKGNCMRDVYLTDAFTTGDLGNVYNKAGKYQGNIGNDVFSFCTCKNEKVEA